MNRQGGRERRACPIRRFSPKKFRAARLRAGQSPESLAVVAGISYIRSAAEAVLDEVQGGTKTKKTGRAKKQEPSEVDRALRSVIDLAVSTRGGAENLLANVGSAVRSFISAADLSFRERNQALDRLEEILDGAFAEKATGGAIPDRDAFGRKRVKKAATERDFAGRKIRRRETVRDAHGRSVRG